MWGKPANRILSVARIRQLPCGSRCAPTTTRPCRCLQERFLFPLGRLRMANYEALVDAVATLGASAVHLSSHLEAAHADADGAGSHLLPPELEV